LPAVSDCSDRTIIDTSSDFSVPPAKLCVYAICVREFVMPVRFQARSRLEETL
jgi:hypothetical protein